ncbi:MAG: hypothetical protein R3F43_23565 [bacterium]
MRTLALLAGLAALAGCGAPKPAPAAAEAQAFRLPDDPRVGVYVSRPWGFTTSSYWVEGPTSSSSSTPSSCPRRPPI